MFFDQYCRETLFATQAAADIAELVWRIPKSLKYQNDIFNSIALLIAILLIDLFRTSPNKIGTKRKEKTIEIFFSIFKYST